MDKTLLVDRLRATELFAAASRAGLERLAARLRERRFDAQQLIFARGEPGDRLYLIEEGRVRLSVVTEDGRELAFRQAGPGDIIGEVAVLDGGARSADATALTPVTAHSLDRADLREGIAADSAFAAGVIAMLCHRLRDTSQQLENIALFPIEVRLARLFQALTADAEKDRQGRIRLTLRMSQSELALLVGASRPKVNGALASLEESGAVTRIEGGYSCHAARLAAIAGSEEA
jgi:CRP/FNR family transcriptional regulator, cyclic AMP receptor protein